MPQLRLWKMEASPPANAVRVLAEYLGLQLDTVDVDFANKEHKSPEFMKINPVGTIPVLKDGDFILVDSHAIMKYLLSKYGGSHSEALYPSGIEERALVDQSLFLDTGVLLIRVKVVALPTLFEGLKGPTTRHIQDIEDGYAIVEAYIGDKQFVAIDHLTIADISIGSTIASLTCIHKLDKKKYPRTSAWLDRMHQIPAFDKYVSNGVKIIDELLEAAWAKNSQ